MLNLIPNLVTDFHRKLASPNWLSSLSTYVERAIDASREYSTSDGEGVVYSAYNEERYMGPLSVVKFQFFVEIEVGRSQSRENQEFYRTCVEYCQKSATFRALDEIVDTPETRKTARHEAARRTALIEESVRQLRASFERREAIYIEKGALRVRVTNIRSEDDTILAEAVEIPTFGFENSLFHCRPSCRGAYHTDPLHWQFGAGDETTRNSQQWVDGYGGWSLYFAPPIVKAIVSLAARWPKDLPAYDRYIEVCRYLEEHRDSGRHRRLIPEKECLDPIWLRCLAESYSPSRRG